MTVNYATPSPEHLYPVAGVRLGLAEAGIRKANRRDLTLLALDPGCTVAGVFTQNRFCAAPVHLCRKHLESGQEIRALIINTGIANAGTGEPGGYTPIMRIKAFKVAPSNCAFSLENSSANASCGVKASV